MRVGWVLAVLGALLASSAWAQQQCSARSAALQWSPPRVAARLAGLGLDCYSSHFRSVDGAGLAAMTDTQLQERGVSDPRHRHTILQQIGKLCATDEQRLVIHRAEQQTAMIDAMVQRLVQARKLLSATKIDHTLPRKVQPPLASLQSLHRAVQQYTSAIQWLHQEQASQQVTGALGSFIRDKASTKSLRLQLGASGDNAVAGWLNVDAVRPKRDDKGTMMQLYYSFTGFETKLPLPDQSCELIYSSHMLEHLSYYHPRTADALMSEMHRLLAPGGVLRLAVPDAAVWLGNYAQGLDPHDQVGLGRQRESFSGPLWEAAAAVYPWWGMSSNQWRNPQMRNATAHRSELAHLLSFIGGAGGADVEVRSDHAIGYDFELLRNTLVIAGFDEAHIKRSAFNKSEVEALRDIEQQYTVAHHTEFVGGSGRGQSISLYVEVRKVERDRVFDRG